MALVSLDALHHPRLLSAHAHQMCADSGPHRGPNAWLPCRGEQSLALGLHQERLYVCAHVVLQGAACRHLVSLLSWRLLEAHRMVLPS
jgi:hypothetical protein